MTDAQHETETGAPVCYRHPNRETWVSCQRCGRHICPECQTQAPVGVQCPECLREGRDGMPRRGPARAVASVLRPNGRPVVTYAIIGVTVAIFLLQLATGGAVTRALIYYPVLTTLEPWRMLTSVFLHSTAFLPHILFNMFALFMFGPALEHVLGRIRFLALYLISGFAGSVAVLLLASPQIGVLGASGAVFGLMGALVVIQRRLGGNSLQIVVIVALNLAIGFFVSGISWQAHVGGLVGGLAVSAILLATRRRVQRPLQIGLLAGLVIALSVIAIVRVVTLAG